MVKSHGREHRRKRLGKDQVIRLRKLFDGVFPVFEQGL
jgi:hypothetical protein